MYKSEYGDQDYLTILERILDRTPQDIDKREGSLLWESFGPDAKELELVYIALDRLINNAYPMSADREHLERFADTYNLYPYDPSQAVLKAEFILDEGYTVEVGDRFQIDGIYYTVTERIDSTLWRITCETAGTVGNRYFGQLLPVGYKPYVQHLRTARIVELLIPGEDPEDTEEFRARVKRYFLHKAYGGNEANYIEWMLAYAGVGDCKILRCPRGLGTVDVYFITSEWRAPTPEFVQEVQDYLEPKGITGPPEIHRCGLGLAPIGHDVIVYPVKERKVNIGLRILYKEGYGWDDVKFKIQELIEAYFLREAKDWGDRNHYTESGRSIDWRDRYIKIKLGEIERDLYDVEGVDDFDRFASSINGNRLLGSLSLNWDEIPILGELIEETEPGIQGGDGTCKDCPYGHDCENCPLHRGT